MSLSLCVCERERRGRAVSTDLSTDLSSVYYDRERLNMDVFCVDSVITIELEY